MSGESPQEVRVGPDKPVSRRDFLLLAGAVPLGVGAASLAGGAAPVGPAPSPQPEASPPLQVPLNALGRTGVRVSRLGLGLDFDVGGSLLFLNLALSWGATQWSTANDYAGGNAELGIGRYFRKFPQDRARVHLVTSGDARDGARLVRQLYESLARMRTDYVDLFNLRGVDDPRELTDDIRRFAEDQKRLGRIRHFGFSTHANMAALLTSAAALPWIDAAMVKFNYRLMGDAAMTAAVEAFGRAGKGLFAMKVLGDGPVRRDGPGDMKLAGHFLLRGFTPQQAALKAVWESPWISSATLHADNTETLASFVKAAVDRTSLSDRDLEELRAHAQATRATFCAGCAARCQGAAGGLPVSEVLRCLTYAGRPGQGERARLEFARLPADVRDRLARADLTAAEAACPNGLALTALVGEACRRLGRA